MTPAAPVNDDYHKTDDHKADYHKGDLPTTLRAAAVEVILDDGLGSFSLREVARRAGVSHAAPGYHFGDVRGLLTSVAIEGFQTLADRTAAASRGIVDPCERLIAIGRSYVRVGVDFPGHCQVIFRDDLINDKDPQVSTAGLTAYAVLEDTVKAIIDERDLNVSCDDVSRLCWSSMQGLVQLHSKFHNLDELTGTASISIEDQAERFTRLILAGVLDAD